ncbi:hypothetical protein PCE1_001572 [Barthelona sp. PCE]
MSDFDSEAEERDPTLLECLPSQHYLFSTSTEFLAYLEISKTLFLDHFPFRVIEGILNTLSKKYEWMNRRYKDNELRVAPFVPYFRSFSREKVDPFTMISKYSKSPLKMRKCTMGIYASFSNRRCIEELIFHFSRALVDEQTASEFLVDFYTILKQQSHSPNLPLTAPDVSVGTPTKNDLEKTKKRLLADTPALDRTTSLTKTAILPAESRLHILSELIAPAMDTNIRFTESVVVSVLSYFAVKSIFQKSPSLFISTRAGVVRIVVPDHVKTMFELCTIVCEAIFTTKPVLMLASAQEQGEQEEEQEERLDLIVSFTKCTFSQPLHIVSLRKESRVSFNYVFNNDGSTNISCTGPHADVLLLELEEHLHTLHLEFPTPITMDTLLPPSAYKSIKKLDAALASKGLDFFSMTSEGSSLLHEAVEHGDSAIVKYLIEKGALLVPNSHSLSPLHIAASRVDQKVFQALETHPSFDSCVHFSDENGWQALHYACRVHNFSAIQCLMNHMDKSTIFDVLPAELLLKISVAENDRGMYIKTALRVIKELNPKNLSPMVLYFAVLHNFADVYTAILEVKPDIIVLPPTLCQMVNNGLYSLLGATLRKNPEYLQLDHMGRTVLHHLIAEGTPDALDVFVDLFVEKIALKIDQEDVAGHAALEYAFLSSCTPNPDAVSKMQDRPEPLLSIEQLELFMDRPFAMMLILMGSVAHSAITMLLHTSDLSGSMLEKWLTYLGNGGFPVEQFTRPGAGEASTDRLFSCFLEFSVVDEESLVNTNELFNDVQAFSHLFFKRYRYTHESSIETVVKNIDWTVTDAFGRSPMSYALENTRVPLEKLPIQKMLLRTTENEEEEAMELPVDFDIMLGLYLRRERDVTTILKFLEIKPPTFDDLCTLLASEPSIVGKESDCDLVEYRRFLTSNPPIKHHLYFLYQIMLRSGVVVDDERLNPLLIRHGFPVDDSATVTDGMVQQGVYNSDFTYAIQKPQFMIMTPATIYDYSPEAMIAYIDYISKDRSKVYNLFKDYVENMYVTDMSPLILDRFISFLGEDCICLLRRVQANCIRLCYRDVEDDDNERDLTHLNKLMKIGLKCCPLDVGMLMQYAPTDCHDIASLIQMTDPVVREMSHSQRRLMHLALRLKGSDALDYIKDHSLRLRMGNTLLHTMARRGRIDEVKHIIEHYDVNVTNIYGETPLHMAARTLNQPLVEFLINEGANPNARSIHSWTPLHEALLFSSNSICRLLLNRVSTGVVNYALLKRNPRGKDRSALTLALVKRRTGIVKQLREMGASLYFYDECGVSTFFYFLLSDMKQYYPSPLDATQGESTPLHWAALTRNTSYARQLLGLDPLEAPDEHEMEEPLTARDRKPDYHFVGEGGMTRIDGGADPVASIPVMTSEPTKTDEDTALVDVYALNVNGHSALDFALKYSAPEIQQLLLEAGAKGTYHSIAMLYRLHRARTISRSVPLPRKDVSVLMSKMDFATFQREEHGDFDQVMDFVVRFTITDAVALQGLIQTLKYRLNDGHLSTLQFFLRSGNAEAIEIALKSFPSEHLQSPQLFSVVLHYKCGSALVHILESGYAPKLRELEQVFVNKDVDTLKVLFKYGGIDASEIDSNGFTPLHYMSLLPLEEFTDAVDTYKGLKDVASVQKLSPFHMAVLNGNEKLALWLMENDASVTSFPEVEGFCSAPMKAIFASVRMNMYDLTFKLAEGASYNCSLDSKDERNNTLLHYAAMAYAETNDGDLFQELLSKGADLMSSNNSEETPNELRVSGSNATPSLTFLPGLLPDDADFTGPTWWSRKMKRTTPEFNKRGGMITWGGLLWVSLSTVRDCVEYTDPLTGETVNNIDFLPEEAKVYFE